MSSAFLWVPFGVLLRARYKNRAKLPRVLQFLPAHAGDSLAIVSRLLNQCFTSGDGPRAQRFHVAGDRTACASHSCPKPRGVESMATRNATRRNLRWSPLALAVTVAIAGVAADVRAQEKDATKLEGVVVTGSRIKKTEVEGAAPVFTLDRKDIEKTGLNSVGDIV